MIEEIIISFLIYSCFVKNNNINECAKSICGYFLFRWITNYRKCTVSYIECKVRGVKKEKGFIYQKLNHIFDYNKSKYRYILYIITLIILLINYHKLNSPFNFS